MLPRACEPPFLIHTCYGSAEDPTCLQAHKSAADSSMQAYLQPGSSCGFALCMEKALAPWMTLCGLHCPQEVGEGSGARVGTWELLS